MNNKQLNLPLFLFLITTSYFPAQPSDDIQYLEVAKCCPKGTYMLGLGRFCKFRPKTKREYTMNETFSPPMDPEKVYWLPHTLRSQHIHVRYAPHKWKGKFIEVDKDEKIVEKFLSINNTARKFFLGVFGNTIIENTVMKQLYCFEGTKDPLIPFVIRTTVVFKSVNKCCKKGEELNSLAKCVTKNGFTTKNVSVDYNLRRESNESYWLPEVINGSVQAHYDIIGKYYWNTFTEANNLASWKLVESDLGYKTLFINPVIPAGIKINTVAQSYCIDSTSKPNVPHVVFGLVTYANKCCKKGEQMDFKELKCVQKPNYNISNDHVGAEIPASSYWLPSKLGNKYIPVLYQYFLSNKAHGSYEYMIKAEENNWVIEISPNEEPKLLLIGKSLSGKSRTFPVTEFCFDAITESPFAPTVLMAAVNCHGIHCVPKCCPRYHVLKRSGKCEPHQSASWHPLNSSMSAFLNPDEIYDISFQQTPYCTGYYTATEFEPKEAAELLINFPEGELSYRTLTRTYYCADYLQVGDELQETVASCEWPPSGRTYAIVRHLSIISVVLMVIAIAALLSQEQMRNSVHGQAMAFHTFSLIATSTLTSAFIYMGGDFKYCLEITFPIYFFLLAAGFWLNIVSVNMTLGFREPPGKNNLPRGRRETKRGKIALIHAYGWGIPAILTAFTVTMFYNTHSEWAKNLYKPSFAETRTCFYEIKSIFLNNSAVYNSELEIASLIYYYGPMGVLVLINSVCLVLTLLKIRSLSKDSKFLQKASAEESKMNSITQILRNTLLYVKLLLFTGAMELVIEATIWGTRKRRFESLNYIRLYAIEVGFIYRISAVILDLFRACAIFWLSVGRIHRGWIQTLRSGFLCLRKNILQVRNFRVHGMWSPKNTESEEANVPGISLQSMDKIEGVSYGEVPK